MGKQAYKMSERSLRYCLKRYKKDPFKIFEKLLTCSLRYDNYQVTSFVLRVVIIRSCSLCDKFYQNQDYRGNITAYIVCQDKSHWYQEVDYLCDRIM